MGWIAEVCSGLSSGLRRIRPSNLVLLAAAPFIIFVFASSDRHLRSLKAVIGIEPGAGDLLAGFTLLFALFASGLLAARRWWLNTGSSRWLAAAGRAALPLHALVIGLILAFPTLADPFVLSAFFHFLDPATSVLVDRETSPWTLKPDVLPLLSQVFRIGLAAYGILFLTVALAARSKADRVPRICIRCFGAVSGTALFFLVFICHWGFATGIAVTFRAAVFAYLLAAILGLVWTGLRGFLVSRLTFPVYAAAGILLLVAGGLLLVPATG